MWTGTGSVDSGPPYVSEVDNRDGGRSGRTWVEGVINKQITQDKGQGGDGPTSTRRLRETDDTTKSEKCLLGPKEQKDESR